MYLNVILLLFLEKVNLIRVIMLLYRVIMCYNKRGQSVQMRQREYEIKKRTVINMQISEFLSLPEKEFVSKVLNASFEEKFAVWTYLHDRLVMCQDIVCFERHFLPLLQPLIQKYKYHLPAHGTYREDFEQEVAIDLYTHLKEYNPYHEGQQYLGNVYFGHRIRCVFQTYVRSVKKENCTISLDGNTNPDGTDFILADYLQSDNNPAEQVIQAITDAEIMEKYHSLRSNYTEYYARRLVKEWTVAQHYV